MICNIEKLTTGTCGTNLLYGGISEVKVILNPVILYENDTRRDEKTPVVELLGDQYELDGDWNFENESTVQLTGSIYNLPDELWQELNSLNNIKVAIKFKMGITTWVIDDVETDYHITNAENNALQVNFSNPIKNSLHRYIPTEEPETKWILQTSNIKHYDAEKYGTYNTKSVFCELLVECDLAGNEYKRDGQVNCYTNLLPEVLNFLPGGPYNVLGSLPSYINSISCYQIQLDENTYGHREYYEGLSALPGRAMPNIFMDDDQVAAINTSITDYIVTVPNWQNGTITSSNRIFAKNNSKKIYSNVVRVNFDFPVRIVSMSDNLIITGFSNGRYDTTTNKISSGYYDFIMPICDTYRPTVTFENMIGDKFDFVMDNQTVWFENNYTINGTEGIIAWQKGGLNMLVSTDSDIDIVTNGDVYAILDASRVGKGTYDFKFTDQNNKEYPFKVTFA